MVELTAVDAAGVRRKARYDASKPLGIGGAGTVFIDQAKSGYVIKIYHRVADPTTLARASAGQAEVTELHEKLQAMLAAPPHQGQGFVQIAWPQEMLFTPDNRFVGFTMREIPRAATTPIEDVMVEVKRKNERLPHDYEFRLIVCQNLATMLGFIHQRGHAMVDLQPQNVRVYRQNGWVALLDCDGYRISSPTKSFPARLLRPDYAAPELQRSGGNVRPDMGNQDQDRFALALIIFTLLNEGVTPYNVRSKSSTPIPDDIPSRIRDALYGYALAPSPKVEPAPASLHAHWPMSLRKLFDRAFSAEKTLRPTADDWALELASLLKSATECRRRPKVHGKSVISGTCLMCEREDLLAKMSGKQISYRSSTRSPPAAPPRPPPPPRAPAARVPPAPPPAPPAAPTYTQRDLGVGARRATLRGLWSGIPFGIGSYWLSQAYLGGAAALTLTGVVLVLAFLLVRSALNNAPQRTVTRRRGGFTAFLLYCSAVIGHGAVGIVSAGIAQSVTAVVAPGFMQATTTEEAPPALPYYEVQAYSLDSPVTPRANVNYRAAPFALPESRIVRVSVVGEQLTVTGFSNQSDGTWYQVTLPEGGAAFVRSDLISLWAPPPEPEPEPAPATPAPAPYTAPTTPSITYGPAPSTQPATRPQSPTTGSTRQPSGAAAPATGSVVFTQRPTARRIADLYPNRALEDGRSGSVTLECTVRSTFNLNCRVGSETPRGQGFGEAALEAAQSYRVAQTLTSGASAVGARTRIVVNFQLPEESRRRDGR